MKRLHVHVAVHDIEQSVRFYKAMFDAEPTVKKDDYAKWQLEDPRVNFAISKRGAKAGLDHLGIQAENEAELNALLGFLTENCCGSDTASCAPVCTPKSRLRSSP